MDTVFGLAHRRGGPDPTTGTLTLVGSLSKALHSHNNS